MKVIHKVDAGLSNPAGQKRAVTQDGRMLHRMAVGVEVQIENDKVYAIYTLVEYDLKTAKDRLKGEEAAAKEVEARLASVGLKNMDSEDLLNEISKVMNAQ